MCEGQEDLSQTLSPALSPTREGKGRRSGGLISLASGEAVLVLTLGVLIANIASHSPWFCFFLAAVSLALLTLLGQNTVRLLKRLAVPSYLTCVAMITAMVSFGHTLLWQVGPLTVYQEGLAQGILVGSKIFAGAVLVFLFATVVRSPVLQPAFQSARFAPPWWQVVAARLHVPAVLIEIALLMYRYLFLLAEETERVREAQALRLCNRTWRTRIDSFSTLLGMVVIRSYDRAEGVFQAMALRGSDNPPPKMEPVALRDLTGLALAIPLSIILLYVGQIT